MFFVTTLLAHTPVWVFVLLAFLVWQGIKALEPQTVSIGRLLIVPGAFLLLGLRSLLMTPTDASAWLAWTVALLLAALLGAATGPTLLAVDPDARMIRRPGSPVPLLRNVAVFALQYVFAVMAARTPEHHAAVAIAARAVSGATSGYFLGWLLVLRRQYRTAPRLVPGAA